MRKLLSLPAFLSVSLTGLALAQAAPEPKCAHYFVKTDKDGPIVANGAYTWADNAPADKSLKNCFADEIFVLDGDQQITALTGGSPAVPGNPTAMPPVPPTPAVPPMMTTVDLVNCKAGMAAGTIDPKDCAIGDFAGQFNGGGLEGAAQKALEFIRTKVPNLPNTQWDEIVFFSADFGPAAQTGPLFFRVKNSAGQFINEVGNIAPPMVLPTAPRDMNKPYVGLINAGNVKAIGTTPWTGTYAPCGRVPRRPIDDPVAGDQAAGALCAPGLYTYFDALAQATANIYGPFLGADANAHGGSFSTMPAIKGALVATGSMGVVTSKFPDGGLVTNVWNAFLNTQGSILGGNTWRDNGNATFTVTRPPAYQGVTAPFEGGQVLRFTAMDLYLMGLIPSGEVPPVQSFMHTQPGNVFQPAVSSFNAAVGPNMGARLSGVAVRTVPGGRPVPKTINFQEIATFNGGERTPNADAAPQHIRQLWVLVTKPKKVVDAAVAAAPEADRAKQAVTEMREQVNQVIALQRFRAEYNRYFHALTGYRGRVHTHFEGNTDDMGYFEFGDARDDNKDFKAGGGLQMEIRGAEEIPNSGGKQMTVLRVKNTGGEGGHILFQPQGRTLKLSGNMKSPAANNLLTVRMRLPTNAPKGLRARITFQGSKDVAIEFPTDPAASLLADGVFHNYSVDLTKTGFVDGEFNRFTLHPALGEAVTDLEIEYVKVSWTAAANLKDSDKDCAKAADAPDGWIDVEDNCKNLYNPDQADGNSDGVGDACEDYDGDNVVNSCDNCPTVTNSSQRDGNNNKSGDACDGDKPSDCFFQTSTVGGPVSPTSAMVWVAGLILGAIVTSAVRRRRRRR